MMCDARLFWPQIKTFSCRIPIHLATITDYDTVEQLAANILENAPGRFALAGLSLGGIVAMEVLRQDPERVDRIALLDTGPWAEQEAVRKGREPQIERARQGRLADVMREDMMPNYLSPYTNAPAILTLCLDMAMTLGPNVFVRQSRALQTRPDQEKTLARFERPALILMGEDDRLCPFERHARMHALIRGSRLAVVPKAGHLPTLEQPDSVNHLMKTWLDL
nr:alpha/beta hydrolase [Roseibium sp. RKSG952]